MGALFSYFDLRAMRGIYIAASIYTAEKPCKSFQILGICKKIGHIKYIYISFGILCYVMFFNYYILKSVDQSQGIMIDNMIGI